MFMYAYKTCTVTRFIYIYNVSFDVKGEISILMIIQSLYFYCLCLLAWW